MKMGMMCVCVGFSRILAGPMTLPKNRISQTLRYTRQRLRDLRLKKIIEVHLMHQSKIWEATQKVEAELDSKGYLKAGFFGGAEVRNRMPALRRARLQSGANPSLIRNAGTARID